MDEVGHVVVEIGEGDAVLGPYRLADDNFVNIIKLIPVFVLSVGVLDKRLEFGTARDGHIQRFSGEEWFQVEQVEVIIVHQIRQQLISETVECCQLRHGKIPFAVGWTIHMKTVHQRFAIV